MQGERALRRVAAYVDGFNLHYGVRDKCGCRHLWLDLQALALALLRPGQCLESVSYFTARFRGGLDARIAQSMYLDALQSHCPQIRMIEGRFQEKIRNCRQCGAAWVDHEEKQTDVSIATALIEDAVQDRYDSALLISADGDLCPAVAAVKRLRPKKMIIGCFPPGRHSTDLAAAADRNLTIGLNKIRQSQLPDAVQMHGVLLRRPAEWT
jgi:uncharacterized LabA/DUF88 family protein